MAGLQWNFNFSPLSGASAQSASARALDWGQLGNSLGKLAQMGQQQAASGPDEYYRQQFASAPLQQQLDWRTQGSLIPQEHRKLVSPEVLNQYRNATPEAAVQWDALRAKSEEVQRQRRDWGRQDAAYEGLRGWMGNAGSGGVAAPDAVGMNRHMLDMAAANGDMALASKWAAALNQAREDALLASAMTGNAPGGAGQRAGGANPQLAQYLSGLNTQLGAGPQNGYGLQRGQLEDGGRDGRFAQLGLAQQRTLAGADALMRHNPTRALEMIGAVNQQLAQDVQRDNALRATVWSGNNQAAYQSAGLGRQDAQLAESMRHNRAGESMAAQRLQWDMAGRGGSGRFNYDPAKIRQWFTADDGAGNKIFDQGAYERFTDLMAQYPEEDPARLHHLMVTQEAAQRLQRQRDMAQIQNNFNALDFTQFMAGEGVAPKSAREVVDFAASMGLKLNAQQAHAVMEQMRRQQTSAANRARFDEAPLAPMQAAQAQLQAAQEALRRYGLKQRKQDPQGWAAALAARQAAQQALSDLNEEQRQTQLQALRARGIDPEKAFQRNK